MEGYQVALLLCGLFVLLPISIPIAVAYLVARRRRSIQADLANDKSIRVGAKHVIPVVYTSEHRHKRQLKIARHSGAGVLIVKSGSVRFCGKLKSGEKIDVEFRKKDASVSLVGNQYKWAATAAVRINAKGKKYYFMGEYGTWQMSANGKTKTLYQILLPPLSTREEMLEEPKKVAAEVRSQKVASGANWFFAISIMTVVLLLVSIPAGGFDLLVIAPPAISAVVFFILGLLARKQYLWPYIAGFALYLLDTISLVVLSVASRSFVFTLAILLHIVGLFAIWSGIKATRELKTDERHK